MAAMLTTLAAFKGANASYPTGRLYEDANGNLFGATFFGGANGDGTVFEIVKTATGYASTPTTVATFNGTNGLGPNGSLIADVNGNLLGTTDGGGYGSGVVFGIASTGSGYLSYPITLVAFPNPQGPATEGLIADANGNLFGTNRGGAYGRGFVFEIVNTGGAYAATPITVASFNPYGPDNSFSPGNLIADANGNLFGEAAGCSDGHGIVFEVAKTATGYASTPTVLATFSGTSGGYGPGTLTADAHGNLFGTTTQGGAYGYGTVFEIVKTAAGYDSTPITLASLNGDDGAISGRLLIDANGDVFGATHGSGTIGHGGTVFEIVHTATGYASTPITVLNLYGTGSSGPTGGLIADANGNLFGNSNDSSNGGTVFEIKGSGFVVPSPTVTAITPSVTGTVVAGQSMTLTVSMSGAVTLSGGTPTLLLNDGGTATYDAQATAALADPTKLVFDYTVSTTDHNEPYLSVIGGYLNGALILGSNGKEADFTKLYTTYVKLNVVANPPATVTDILTSLHNTTAHAGNTIVFTVVANEGLTVAGGTPTLVLNDGGIATYDATATAALGDPTRLLFSYTVGASDKTVPTLAIVGGYLNGATVTDARGNAPDYSGLTHSFPGLAVDPPPPIAAATMAALPPGIDLSGIAFGPNTTLGYAPNSANTGGTLAVSDGQHNAAIALLGQYAAADFHAQSDFAGGTLVTDPTLSGAALTTFLASPHS